MGNNKEKADYSKLEVGTMAKDLLYDLKIMDSDEDKLRLIEDFIGLVLIESNK